MKLVDDTASSRCVLEGFRELDGTEGRIRHGYGLSKDVQGEALKALAALSNSEIVLETEGYRDRAGRTRNVARVKAWFGKKQAARKVVVKPNL